MRRPLALIVLLVAALPAFAVIKVLTPLKQVLAAEEMIFLAEVTAVDADKPSVTFAFAENLKGTAPFEKLPVNLTGDSYAKKDDHAKVMTDRLAPKRQAVFFVSKAGQKYAAFGFVEGTWFQMQGTIDADGKTVRWAFLHCEPYFRRTFKGTTAELKEVVQKYVAGKGEPPPPDEKEPAGYGPKVDKKCGPEDGGGGPVLFGVIPSFVLIGPLALVAALFPGVFAKLAVQLKRWRAFLTVASANSTLALAYYWLREYLPDVAWASPTAATAVLLVLTVIGLLWSGLRYRRMAVDQPAVTAPPAGREIGTLAGLTAAVWLLVAATGYFAGRAAVVEMPWREFTAIAGGLTAATVYAGYRRLTRRVDGPGPTVWLSLSGESVALCGVLLFTAGTILPSGSTVNPLVLEQGDSTDGGLRVADVTVWPLDSADEVLSGVRCDNTRLYFGTLKQTGFRGTGAVWAFDTTTGKAAWTFDDGGGLKPVYSTPAVDGGAVFVGEGLHTDADCRLFRLSAADGKLLWSKPTTSHIEGLRAGDGRVLVAAGDDGVYAFDAAGKELWHARGTENKLHIDTPPVPVGRRVFAGSGYHTFALLALDAGTGSELWRTPVNLRAFGPPLVSRDDVFYGLGTGNLIDDLSTEPEPGVPAETTPSGAVVCVDAKTGQMKWQFPTPKSVHTALAIEAGSVIAACKDGMVYAINRKTGELRWKRPVGETFTGGPVVAGGAVYAVTHDGRIVCLDARTGRVFWTRELTEAAGKAVKVLSAPTVVETDAGRTLYIGAGLTARNTGAKQAAVFRITDVSD